MDPQLRQALLALGIGFCAIFGALTLYATVKLGAGLATYGDLLGMGFMLVSLLVIGMIGAGLYGAIKNPPPDE